MLSGETSKTWVASKIKDASGDKEKLTDAEKEEKMIFHSSGQFSLVTTAGTETGTWKMEGDKTLTIQFQNAATTMSFAVEELGEDKAKLKAADGSTLQMKAE